MTDPPWDTTDLERAIAQLALNRYVVRLRSGSYLDTNQVEPGDVVIFDRADFNARRQRETDKFFHRQPLKGHPNG